MCQARVWINFASNAHQNTIMLVLIDAKTIKSEQKSIWSPPIRREYLLATFKFVIALCWHSKVCLRVVKVPPVKVIGPLLFLYLLLSLHQFLLLFHDFLFNLRCCFHKFEFLLRNFFFFFLDQVSWIFNDLLCFVSLNGCFLLFLLSFFLFVVVIFWFAAFFFFDRLRTPFMIWFFFVIFTAISRPETSLFPDFNFCRAFKNAIFYTFSVLFSNLLYNWFPRIWLFFLAKIASN